MKVVFRVDASQWIGTGHVMRCLVLAKQLKAKGLKAKGWKIEFACVPQIGELITFIEPKGYLVRKLISTNSLKM